MGGQEGFSRDVLDYSSDSNTLMAGLKYQTKNKTEFIVKPVGGRMSVTQVRMNFSGKMLNDLEDHAWLPSGSILSARGRHIFRWMPGTSEVWEQVATVEGVREVTRIAVSPAGDRLVLVASD